MSSLTELAAEMQPMPGISLSEPATPLLQDGRVSFAAHAGAEPPQPVGKQLVDPIHAGGEGDATRWSTFNQVAGHYLHCARVGQMSLTDAYDKTQGWVETSMVPPWPKARIETEFRALANKDVKASGPFHLAAEPHTAVMLPPGWSPQMVAVAPEGRVFDIAGRFDVGVFTAGEKPKRRFLVEGLIQAGTSHLLAAEGGAGKTGQILDLGLKMAAYELDKDGNPVPGTGGNQLMWWGQALTPECAGKNVVIVTSEDDLDEIHIRLKEMDEYGLLSRVKGRLFVVTLVDVGGAFPFVRKNKAGDAEASKDWLRLFGEIKAIPNVGLVIVDTLNSTLHGEDVRPDVIQEYFNQLTPLVCGELKAALMVTHHIHKAGKVPISTVDHMKDSVRGSSALPAAVRAVLGFWHAHDFKSRLAKMGERVEHGRCYMAAVVKANNPEFTREVKTLVRDRWGTFIDRTKDKEVKELDGPASYEAGLWLLIAIGRAARDNYPFEAAYTSPAVGIDARKSDLPKACQMGRDKLQTLVKGLRASGDIVVATLSGKAKKVLDVKGGKAAAGNGFQNDGAWTPPKWEEEYRHMPGTLVIAERNPPAWTNKANA